MKVLVTGGAGYIGSVAVRLLSAAGHKPVIFDNLSTGHRSFVPKGVPFIKGDLRNYLSIRRVFEREEIDAVMHFAASCLVGESVENPLKYYENNVLGGSNLLEAMREAHVRFFILSSTCAVYGEPEKLPIREDFPTRPTNPYGHTKLIVENILKHMARTGDIEYIALRYFNACGALASGEVGEQRDPETHLIPNILKALTGEKKELLVFGDDYPTPDGTCIRDYIHVEDLARAHLLALNALKKGIRNEAINLGTGKGFSIKQIIRAAERVAGKKVNCRICARRPGDPARLVANSAKARKVLGWRPKHGLSDIVRSAWRWEQVSSKSRRKKGG